MMLAPNLAANARLIHIYRKSAAGGDQLAAGASPNEQRAAEHTETRTIEFASPMKRIMELIGQHAPLVVLSDSAAPADTPPPRAAPQPEQQAQQAQHLRQQQQSAASQGIASSALLQPQFIDAGQQLAMQPSLAGYEQYYLAPAGQLGEQPPVAMVADSLGAFQQANQQPMSYFQAQQPAPQLLASQPEERTQPIFLSSYSPELVRPAMVPLQLAPVEPARPTSIQQSIGQQHVQPPAPPAPPASQAQQQQQDEPEDSGEPSEGGGSDPRPPEADREAGGGPDDDEPDEPSSGSLSYEDKYDSSKPQAGAGSSDEAQHVEPGPSAAASSHGLVGVGLNDDCLQCICRASSGCDHLLRCITRGADEKHCGPFQLTEEYWQQAGAPGDAAANFQSFEECANEADCAVETVTNYMKKYHRDCDGDDNITCMDYARLHRLKPSECSDTEKLASEYDAYWAKFQRCAEGYNRSRNGDDEDI